MTTTNINRPSFLSSDLADGYALRVVGLRIIDGIAGWTLAQTRDGLMAYAPMWYAHLYGEIARQV